MFDKCLTSWGSSSFTRRNRFCHSMALDTVHCSQPHADPLTMYLPRCGPHCCLLRLPILRLCACHCAAPTSPEPRHHTSHCQDDRGGECVWWPHRADLIVGLGAGRTKGFLSSQGLVISSGLHKGVCSQASYLIAPLIPVLCRSASLHASSPHRPSCGCSSPKKQQPL